MFTSNFVLFLVLIVAMVGLATADFSCFFGDTICKSVTCRSCTIASCINGECVCTICS